jgi:hypothetical protein
MQATSFAPSKNGGKLANIGGLQWVWDAYFIGRAASPRA